MDEVDIFFVSKNARQHRNSTNEIAIDIAIRIETYTVRFVSTKNLYINYPRFNFIS